MIDAAGTMYLMGGNGDYNQSQPGDYNQSQPQSPPPLYNDMWASTNKGANRTQGYSGGTREALIGYTGGTQETRKEASIGSTQAQGALGVEPLEGS